MAAQFRLATPGCTGCKLTIQITNDMKRLGKKYGIVTACVGGGQGVQVLLKISTDNIFSGYITVKRLVSRLRILFDATASFSMQVLPILAHNQNM